MIQNIEVFNGSLQIWSWVACVGTLFDTCGMASSSSLQKLLPSFHQRKAAEGNVGIWLGVSSLWRSSRHGQLGGDPAVKPTGGIMLCIPSVLRMLRDKRMDEWVDWWDGQTGGQAETVDFMLKKKKNNNILQVIVVLWVSVLNCSSWSPWIIIEEWYPASVSNFSSMLESQQGPLVFLHLGFDRNCRGGGLRRRSPW